MSTFEDAPPGWFAEKGLSEPKSCKECRSWIKAQVDSSFICKNCGDVIIKSARSKISYHKRMGVYEDPDLCLPCETGERFVLPDVLSPPEPVPLLDVRGRSESLEVISYDGLSSYRKNHYGKHIAGHPLSEVGNVTPDGKVVSFTSLVEENSSEFEFYDALTRVAEATQGVYQYKTSGGIAKVTIVGGSHVEVSIFRRRSDGLFEPVTSYDEMKIEHAQLKIRRGEWQ